MILKERGILALDNMSFSQAYVLAAQTSSRVLGFKLEALLLDPVGTKAVIKTLKEYGIVFADAKTHRIPSTAAEEVRMLASYGADMVSVHAPGGLEMMTGCVDAYKKQGPEGGRGVVAITLLTSITGDECYTLYGAFSPLMAVQRYAALAQKAGAYGFVCSPQELPDLQEKLPGMKRVVTSIRSLGEATHDQKRIGTPAEALKGGADYFVIGRQITRAQDPIAALDALEAELAAVA